MPSRKLRRLQEFVETFSCMGVNGARWPTCVHEAGHATVAMALGVTVLSIHGGSHETDGCCKVLPPAHWQDEVLILMAGYLAARHVAGDTYMWPAAISDRRKIAYRFQRHGADPAARTALWDRAGDIVTDSLPAVLTLADMLMEHDIQLDA